MLVCLHAASSAALLSPLCAAARLEPRRAGVASILKRLRAAARLTTSPRPLSTAPAPAVAARRAAMAEVGSIRGGDGSIPGEEEIKEEPQFLASTTRLAILSAMAPTRGEAEIRDLRRLVLAAEPTKTYTIPSQVEPKYTCDVCGNRDQTKFLHESKDGDVVCMGIGDQGCGNVVEEHKLFEGNQFRKFEGP